MFFLYFNLFNKQKCYLYTPVWELSQKLAFKIELFEIQNIDLAMFFIDRLPAENNHSLASVPGKRDCLKICYARSEIQTLYRRSTFLGG